MIFDFAFWIFDLAVPTSPPKGGRTRRARRTALLASHPTDGAPRNYNGGLGCGGIGGSMGDLRVVISGFKEDRGDVKVWIAASPDPNFEQVKFRFDTDRVIKIENP